jgi:alkylglycerol monooxygenase
VHHGVNFKYLDKNFGEFLIIWDRLFGTFAEETDKVVYGMYNPPQSWNPININFHYYKTLWQDAVDAPYFWDKIRLWFMPLGWRPRGLPAKPILIETTLENQVRFQTKMFPQTKPYLIVQAILGIFLMMMVIKSNSVWDTQERWIGAFLLWFQIVNWSGILESKSWLFIAEIIRIPLTVVCVLLFSPISTPLTLGLIVIAIISMFWTFRYFRNEDNNLIVS